jgi:transposase InsO family protein
VSCKYEFIDGEKANFAIVKMCAWAGVSTSGFYEWRDRPASATAQRRAQLTERIKKIFTDSDETYGYRRVWHQLQREGVACGPELVRFIMRAQGLVPCQPKPWRCTTIADQAAAATPDLLCRDFTAQAPGLKLIGDITYIPTWQGFVYLATVIDCHTRMVAGYAIADHMTAQLVCEALAMAARRITIAQGATFHSDRGTQYVSHRHRQMLATLGIRPSVGRTGVCWDNAAAESFFASLKNERTHRTVYPTKKLAISDVTRYIELRYNTRRIHSGLGYRTPQEVYHELNRTGFASG